MSTETPPDAPQDVIATEAQLAREEAHVQRLREATAGDVSLRADGLEAQLEQARARARTAEARVQALVDETYALRQALASSGMPVEQRSTVPPRDEGFEAVGGEGANAPGANADALRARVEVLEGVLRSLLGWADAVAKRAGVRMGDPNTGARDIARAALSPSTAVPPRCAKCGATLDVLGECRVCARELSPEAAKGFLCPDCAVKP